MGNKHKTMLPVRLFFNLNNSGLESRVSIHRHGNCVGFETPTDCHSFSKKEFTFGRDQQARIVDKNFLKGGGTYMKSWHAKKKSPSFPKNLQNPNSVGEGGGWSEEKKWDGDRPTPLPNALTPMLCVWSMLNLRGGSPLWSPTSIKMSVSVVGFWI